MSFVLRGYRPHVEETGGEVATPDLLVGRVEIVLVGRQSVAIDAHSFSTAVAIQTRPSRTCGLPAWVVVGASRGTLVAPGVVHADLAALHARDDWLACRAGPHLVSRFARRLAPLAQLAGSVQLWIEDGEGAGKAAVRTLGDAAATWPWLQSLLDGAPLGRGRMVFFATDHTKTLTAGARRVVLSCPAGSSMSHPYTVVSLESGVGA